MYPLSKSYYLLLTGVALISCFVVFVNLQSCLRFSFKSKHLFSSLFTRCWVINHEFLSNDTIVLQKLLIVGIVLFVDNNLC